MDPTLGSEIQKTRPCLILSPDEINHYLQSIIVAPMTTTERPNPTRVNLTFQGKRGQVAVDQLRVVDGQRLVRKLGKVSAKTAKAVSTVLVEMFIRLQKLWERGTVFPELVRASTGPSRCSRHFGLLAGYASWLLENLRVNQ
jgi:mRNA interferase MazF